MSAPSIFGSVRPEKIQVVFHLPQSELRSRIYPLADVLGGLAGKLQERVCDSPDVDGKMRLVPGFLHDQLRKKEKDEILDFCVSAITTSGGRVTVRQLENMEERPFARVHPGRVRE